MASIRKRKWQSGGETKEAWVADYFDQAGQRHIKTFQKWKDANSWKVDAEGEVKAGVHTADSASKTIAEAGEEWITDAIDDGLEKSTTKQYREHLDLHIVPFIGPVKLSRLTAPDVADFKRQLRQAKRSPAMVKKIVRSLGSIVAYALEHGMVARNVVKDARSRRQRKQEKRQKGRVVIPSKDEIRAMLDKATGRWRPLIVTAIFTGLRASELRGLTWTAVDLDKKLLTVRQRADAWNTMGDPKSDAGRREVPLAPMVANTLKEWKLACPKGDLDLVFPNGAGRIESHANIWNRGFGPLQVACGIVDGDGKPKYGLHALRHAAASLFIEQGFSPKRVQTIMGHSGIQITFDTYGHLFPSPEDDQKQMEQMQARLLA